jgi:hypothetical protein
VSSLKGLRHHQPLPPRKRRRLRRNICKSRPLLPL